MSPVGAVDRFRGPPCARGVEWTHADGAPTGRHGHRRPPGLCVRGAAGGDGRGPPMDARGDQAGQNTPPGVLRQPGPRPDPLEWATPAKGTKARPLPAWGRSIHPGGPVAQPRPPGGEYRRHPDARESATTPGAHDHGQESDRCSREDHPGPNGSDRPTDPHPAPARAAASQPDAALVTVVGRDRVAPAHVGDRCARDDPGRPGPAPRHCRPRPPAGGPSRRRPPPARPGAWWSPPVETA